MTHQELEEEVRRLGARLDAGQSEDGYIGVRETQEDVLPDKPAVSGAAKQKRGRGYWVAWSTGLISVGLVVGLGMVLMIKYVNGPVEAKASTTTLDKERAKVAPTPSTNVFSGKYIELSYPSVFDTVGNMSNNSSAMDQYYISSKAATSQAISLGVFKLESNNVEDDSSYKYRLVHPELYTRTSEKIGKETLELMTKKDNTEQTLFWAHKGKCLNLAITSTEPRAKAADFMRTIIPTLRWKE